MYVSFGEFGAVGGGGLPRAMSKCLSLVLKFAGVGSSILTVDDRERYLRLMEQQRKPVFCVELGPSKAQVQRSRCFEDARQEVQTY